MWIDRQRTVNMLILGDKLLLIKIFQVKGEIMNLSEHPSEYKMPSFNTFEIIQTW